MNLSISVVGTAVRLVESFTSLKLSKSQKNELKSSYDKTKVEGIITLLKNIFIDEYEDVEILFNEITKLIKKL